jgi:hypothetical protein
VQGRSAISRNQVGYNRAMDWTSLLVEQLTFHRDQQERPRLEGLTDDGYLWEPVPGAWVT